MCAFRGMVLLIVLYLYIDSIILVIKIVQDQHCVIIKTVIICLKRYRV